MQELQDSMLFIVYFSLVFFGILGKISFTIGCMDGKVQTKIVSELTS
jgi:hypothetical protein